MEDNKLCLEKQPLSDELLNKMNAYWRAAKMCIRDSYESDLRYFRNEHPFHK